MLLKKQWQAKVFLESNEKFSYDQICQIAVKQSQGRRVFDKS